MAHPCQAARGVGARVSAARAPVTAAAGATPLPSSSSAPVPQARRRTTTSPGARLRRSWRPLVGVPTSPRCPRCPRGTPSAAGPPPGQWLRGPPHVALPLSGLPERCLASPSPPPPQETTLLGSQVLDEEPEKERPESGGLHCQIEEAGRGGGVSAGGPERQLGASRGRAAARQGHRDLQARQTSERLARPPLESRPRGAPGPSLLLGVRPAPPQPPWRGGGAPRPEPPASELLRLQGSIRNFAKGSLVRTLPRTKSPLL